MAIYYLSTLGNDSNNGTSPTTAFLTLYKGISSLASGDTLNIIADGTYTPSGGGQYWNGNKSNVTIQGINGRPLIVCTSGRTGMQFENNNYVTLKNLEFRGDADNITYAAAKAAYDNNTSTGNAVFSANGIQFRNGHHLSVLNCKVTKFPGGGIAFSNCDYMKVDRCLVTDCTKYSAWGNQGITALFANNFDSNTTTYRNEFTNNRSLRNVNLIPWSTVVGGTGTINEGAGLMLDTTERNQANTAIYTGKTLFADNYAAENGNSGIQIFKAKNVDLVRNYCVKNCQNIDGGEVLIHYSDNVDFSDGLISPKDSSSEYATIKYTTNCTFADNRIVDFYGENTSTSNTNLIKYGTT